MSGTDYQQKSMGVYEGYQVFRNDGKLPFMCMYYIFI